MTHKIHEFNCSTKQQIVRDATSIEVALAHRDKEDDKQRQVEQQTQLKEKAALVKKAAKVMGLTVTEYLILFPVVDIKDVE